MHDGMQYDPIQGQGQGHEPLKVGNPSIFINVFPPPFTMLAGNWWRMIKLGHNIYILQAEFLIFVEVFVSRDFFWQKR